MRDFEMHHRILFEIDDQFWKTISKNKREFISLLKAAESDDEKARLLSARYGTTLIHVGNGHEKLVVNADGDTVFRR